MVDHAPADGRPSTVLSLDDRVDMLRSMIEIRFFEEEVQRLFEQALVRGSTHLCQGQEAVVVGACRALAEGDTMTCTYRGHGAVLAMGAPLDRTFGELIGKADGLCGGKGGSMHLTDVTIGAYGSFAVVGAHLPISVGLAFASQYRESGEVALCFFGDGSTNIGAFHEALNLASIWALPVVFVCENNLYGEYSPLSSTTPIEHLADRAHSYAMPGTRVDGNDLLAVYDVISEAAERARSGGGPTLVEALTYRHKGHSRSDPATYRPEGELEEWLKRDPILLHERALLGAGVEQGTLDAVREAARAAVKDASAQAKSWADPEIEARLEHVWA